jgi:hypothetical protein
MDRPCISVAAYNGTAVVFLDCICYYRIGPANGLPLVRGKEDEVLGPPTALTINCKNGAVYITDETEIERVRSLLAREFTVSMK